jgi:hypothetical protein
MAQPAISTAAARESQSNRMTGFLLADQTGGAAVDIPSPPCKRRGARQRLSGLERREEPDG